MNWLFFDQKPVLVDAWKSVGLGARCASFVQVAMETKWKFLVTPGNSFGIMDGGFDQVVCEAFGWKIQDRVQEAIQRWHGGMCPVGSCVSVPLDEHGHHLIYAPTMEVPQRIQYTLNVFWAMRAAAMRVKVNWIPSQMADTFALCPGLGTSTGRVSPGAAAMQMAAALDLENLKAPKWPQALRVMGQLDRMRSVG